ncbi:tail fiber protein [Alteromonas sp. ASW11-36]|uniref:Tail fiber protein n=1 Tax=Alteromonas arenosi TaxID=3055817 RepID=A0ABT7SXJ0_9ALTE|nr:tail fiber protein [Alteromonas sp. ASW11-36]MDM7860902.1 tail fiber protein [Alteromonas sp. ASW11-36]
MTYKAKTKQWLAASLGIVFFCMGYAPKTYAGSDPLVGDIMLFGGNFCPRGWADANGALLAISSNNALFSLYGTTYGGDGRTTFALPDLRSRVPLGQGNGPGLTDRRLGSKSGSERLIITANNLGGHTHVATTASTLNASSLPGTTSDPSGNSLADDAGEIIYNGSATPDTTMASNAATSSTVVSVSGNGSSTSPSGQQPYITMRYCVALFGVYPARN